ncbi:RDD family protein [Streptomyces minutiscleroticus]|uniref:RDD domain-containing protein n=1 Tax=Streptomyces minutiscleroticus TaxID=68238 RepID=A0A918NS35_9ACTN|nr:RDD family protein [Streptomyces minutiscleroticus]GGX90650.1 hypothetical protein GCM10010358_50810 [Streptomyces minutiscleroticus]
MTPPVRGGGASPPFRAPGPSVQGLPAGLVSRTTAAVLDAGVLFAAALTAHFAYAAGRYLLLGPPFAMPDPAAWLTFSTAGTLAVGYLAGSWVTGGRTAGNQVMGLRVTSRSGHRLTLATAVVRAVLCVVFPVGLLWIPVSRRSASVQDVVVDSAVAHDWYGRTRPPVRPRAAGRDGGARS